jgi:hypothetical protein
MNAKAARLIEARLERAAAELTAAMAELEATGLLHLHRSVDIVRGRLAVIQRRLGVIRARAEREVAPE